MAEKITPQKKVKVEVRPASNILKVLLIVLILFSIVALIALRWVHNGILNQIDELKDEASGLEHANAELDRKTEELGSVQSIQDIAKEELGLVDPAYCKRAVTVFTKNVCMNLLLVNVIKFRKAGT